MEQWWTIPGVASLQKYLKQCTNGQQKVSSTHYSAITKRLGKIGILGSAPMSKPLWKNILMIPESLEKCFAEGQAKSRTFWNLCFLLDAT